MGYDEEEIRDADTWSELVEGYIFSKHLINTYPLLSKTLEEDYKKKYHDNWEQVRTPNELSELCDREIESIECDNFVIQQFLKNSLTEFSELDQLFIAS